MKPSTPRTRSSNAVLVLRPSRAVEAFVLGLVLTGTLRCNHVAQHDPHDEGNRAAAGAPGTDAAAGAGADNPPERDTDESGHDDEVYPGGSAGAPSKPIEDTSMGGAGSEPVCNDSIPASPDAPKTLSATSLYADIQQKTIASPFNLSVPRFHLWSDGAEKTRWLYLPECSTIDTRDWDHWSFPVGTRAFKEFAVDGKRIETRMVHRFGEGPDDFLFAHYLWNDDETEAYLIDESTPLEMLQNPRGTNYTVPTPDLCTDCHGRSDLPQGGLPSRYLGPSAIQLGHSNNGLTLDDLRDSQRLSHPQADDYEVPGKPVTRAALGYLHANCGFCHNETPDGVVFPFEPMNLLLSTRAKKLHDSGVYSTSVGHQVLGYRGTCTDRVYPKEPDLSCVLERMKTRDPLRQMPPLATHQVDSEGTRLIEEWISGM